MTQTDNYVAAEFILNLADEAFITPDGGMSAESLELATRLTGEQKDILRRASYALEQVDGLRARESNLLSMQSGERRRFLAAVVAAGPAGIRIGERDQRAVEGSGEKDWELVSVFDPLTKSHIYTAKRR